MSMSYRDDTSGKPVSESTKGPKYLGKIGVPMTTPEDFVLDVVQNPHQDKNYVARFTCPEVTSLCPVTGQPDFATFVIDYVPDKWLVESKALKLYFFTFRNHHGFHEDCTISVGKKIIQAAAPRFIRVCAFWMPRGGIPIDVFFQEGDLEYLPNVILLDPGVNPYRGR